MEMFGVDVRRNGELILTIESAFLSGKSDLSEEDLDCIRRCGTHLLAFAGAAADEKRTSLDTDPTPF